MVVCSPTFTTTSLVEYGNFTSASSSRRPVMRQRRSVRVAFLASLFMFAMALHSFAQGVGGIGGTVMDETGAVLPGANVALSNAQGTVGGNQETVTDVRGAYQFLRLVPGTYTVRA